MLQNKVLSSKNRFYKKVFSNRCFWEDIKPAIKTGYFPKRLSLALTFFSVVVVRERGRPTNAKRYDNVRTIAMEGAELLKKRIIATNEASTFLYSGLFIFSHLCSTKCDLR
jgi:hypothetical protein